MKNYQEAVQFLGTKDRRKLENNTYLERRTGESIAIKYHATDIVVFYQTFTEFFTDGWRTVTTKARLNRYGLNVWQKDGEWYIDQAHHTFQEGLRKYTETGLYSGYGEDQKKQRNALKKQIKAYSTQFIDQVYEGKIQHPLMGIVGVACSKGKTEKR